MKFPAWLQPGIFGAIAGAIVLAIVGFNWGGWVTSGSAKDMAAKQSISDVASALTPYCVAQSKADPNAATAMAALKAANTYDRGGIVAKAGWATAPGGTAPNNSLAQSCQLELAKAF